MEQTTIVNLTEQQAAELTQQISPAMLQVFTTKQQVKPPMLAVEVSARASKGKTIPPEQRYRCIIVPEQSLQVPADQVPGKFRLLIEAAIYGIAKSRLEAAWEDGDQREVKAEDFDINALLEWNEQRAKGLDITKQALIDWFKTSATFTALEVDTKRAAWIAVLGKLSANATYQNAVTPTEAATLIGKLSEDDSETRIGQWILRRAQNVIDAATKSKDVSDAM